MSRFQFVADHQRRYGVKRLCQVLEIPRSSYYHWHRSDPVRAARQAADARLTAEIRAVHQASDGTYGVPRITAELRDGGLRVNHKKVARLMKDAGPARLRLRRSTAPPSAIRPPLRRLTWSDAISPPTR